MSMSVKLSAMLTRYIVRRLNLVTVNARMVALTRPQPVRARLMRFLERLSWMPIPSRMRARRYLGDPC
jgi:hypothetical protein